jgi:hypothetical protein
VVGKVRSHRSRCGSLNAGSRSPHTISAGRCATRGSPRSTSDSSSSAARISLGITCTGIRDAGVGCGRLYISFSALESIFRLTPPGTNTLVNRSRRSTSRPPGKELPRSWRTARSSSPLDRPAEGVADDEGPEPLGVPDCHGEPDGSAPVLDHQRDALQPELGDEPLHHPGVLGNGVAERVAGMRAAVSMAGPGRCFVETSQGTLHPRPPSRIRSSRPIRRT